MTKVRDLRNFYKTMMKKSNRKSNDKVPSEAEISIISNEMKSYIQSRKNYNTSGPERIKNEVGE